MFLGPLSLQIAKQRSILETNWIFFTSEYKKDKIIVWTN